MQTELLAPAGNHRKLQTAAYFGADAIYVGGKSFSLRAFSENFTEDELKNAVKTTHAQGKKLYVTANVYAKNADFPMLEEYFSALEKLGADAVIVSDPGVVYAAKKAAPKLAIHISTQANTTNKYAVRFWKEQGVSRVILARELTLGEIAEIKAFEPTIELETFVHGAMCISYSGRCLLSDYLDGRSSNRGACVQACRWRYEVRALNPSNGETGWLPIEQDGRGTYIFNSKDLNMLAHLKELKRAGVDSFKIEGRMKSEYYLATVINAYRRALDGAEGLEKELESVMHRDYTTAYAFGENTRTVNYTDGQSKGDCEYIANVLSCENGVVEAEMRNRFKTGDVLEILSPNESFGKSLVVGEIRDSKGDSTNDAKLVQERYTFDCPYPLAAGDILRRRRA